jgi:hypothetical protein
MYRDRVTKSWYVLFFILFYVFFIVFYTIQYGFACSYIYITV